MWADVRSSAGVGPLPSCQILTHGGRPHPCNPLLPLPSQGYHGDTSRMFYVGNVPPAARQLCEATKEALDAGGWCCWGGSMSCGVVKLL